MGKLGLGNSQVLCRLFLRDSAFFPQQCNDAIELHRHDFLPSLPGHALCGALRKGAVGPCPNLFYVLYIISLQKHFVNTKSAKF